MSSSVISDILFFTHLKSFISGRACNLKYASNLSVFDNNKI